MDRGRAGGQHVRRELQAAESTTDRLGQSTCHESLSHAWNVLDEDVPAGKHCNYRQAERLLLDDDRREDRVT